MVAATGVLPSFSIHIPPPSRVPDSTLKLYVDCMNGFQLNHFLAFFTLTNKRDEACTSSTWIDETNRWTNHSLPSTKSELLLNYCFTGNQSDNICGNCCSLLSTHGYIPWYMQHPNLTHQSMGVDYIEQRFWRVSMEEVPTYEVWVNWQFLFLNHSMGWSFYAPHQLQSSHDSDLDQPIKFVCFSLLWFVCTWLQISHTIVYGELQFYNIFLLNKK